MRKTGSILVFNQLEIIILKKYIAKTLFTEILFENFLLIENYLILKNFSINKYCIIVCAYRSYNLNPNSTHMIIL